jgi:hypothetical protein
MGGNMYNVDNLPESEGYRCPKCQSEQCQKLSMLVASGTTHGSSEGIAVGLDVSRDSKHDIGIGVMNMTNVSQTALAKQYTPPNGRLTLGEVFIGLLGLGFIWFWIALFVGLVVLKIDSDPPDKIVFLILSGWVVLLFYLISRYKSAKRAHEAIMPLYHRFVNIAHICFRCGSLFKIKKDYAGDIQDLLVKGGINTIDKEGYTPLMNAISAGALENNTAFIQALIENGADVNAKSAHGVTALCYAAAAGNTNAVKILLEKGADVKAKGENGLTFLAGALMLAKKGRHYDMVKILENH